MQEQVAVEELIKDLFVPIASGTVEMRDDRTKELWTVDILPFALAKYPVTQLLYQAVLHDNPAAFRGDALPVETVSWMDAVNFCNQLSVSLHKTPCYTLDSKTGEVLTTPQADGFRLPTEAEWQFACQAGTRSIRYGELADIAWFKENANDQTQEVGQKQPNPWGLYDMLGNVWEWCSDIYDQSVYGEYRIFRGGGWCDQERSVMATTRRRSHPIYFKIDDLGFRIARNAPL
ncbi:MAG: SUMF1/EgtB/PvdO family nonheme iron enzyme [Bacteroidota bacterium]